MQFYNKIILTIISICALGGTALAAEYAVSSKAFTTLNLDQTPAPDGNSVVHFQGNSIATVEGMPEGYPGLVISKCIGSRLQSPEWTNLGEAFICTVLDADGDGYINMGNVPNPDWTGCTYKSISAWGKYAGTTMTGQCGVSGWVDVNHIVLEFSATFTTPD